MKRIRRDKAGATHYATAVTSRGTIEGWSRDPADAVVITEGMAQRIWNFYRHRPNVGDLRFEDIKVTDDLPMSQAVQTADAIGAAEFQALQAQCLQLQAEVLRLQGELASREIVQESPVPLPQPEVVPELEPRPESRPSSKRRTDR